MCLKVESAWLITLESITQCHFKKGLFLFDEEDLLVTMT
jgi:hypothetical protein